LFPNGDLDLTAPVYVKEPSKFSKDLEVLDHYNYRLVAPFNSTGDVNSREDQQ
jgi:hypothetical protein